MRSYLFLILTVILFSGNIIVGKAMNDIPPLSMVFIRCLLAFLIILPIGFREASQHMNTFRTEWKPLFGLALTGVAFFNAWIYASLQFTSSANVAIIETAIPVVTILLSFFFLKERLNRYQWFGVILSLFGAVWVITEGSWSMVQNLDFNTGNVLMLGAVFTWAAYSILVKKHMMKFPVYGGLTVMLAIAVVALLPLAVIEWTILGFPDIFHVNNMLGLLYLGIFPSVVALIFWNRGVAEIGPSRASIFLNLLPVFTMLGAFIFLNERVTMVQLLGAVVVIGGVLLTTKKQRSTKRTLERPA